MTVPLEPGSASRSGPRAPIRPEAEHRVLRFVASPQPVHQRHGEGEGPKLHGPAVPRADEAPHRSGVDPLSCPSFCAAPSCSRSQSVRDEDASFPEHGRARRSGGPDRPRHPRTRCLPLRGDDVAWRPSGADPGHRSPRRPDARARSRRQVPSRSSTGTRPDGPPGPAPRRSPDASRPCPQELER